MAIPSAVATFIEFKPTIVINPHPKDIFDKAMGAVSGFINENLRSMRLNVTLLPTDRTGTCDYKTQTCTGMRGHLQTGAADFSLMQLTATDMDPRFAFPHRYGPQVYRSNCAFGSYPIAKEESAELDVMTTIFDVPPAIYGAQFILFFVCFFLINLNLLTVSSHSWFQYRYQIIHMWSHVLMHPMISFSRVYRRILLSMMLIWCVWAYAMLMGSAKSDLTVTTPPKYMEKLEDVAASNLTGFIVGGLLLAQHFDFSDDPIRKKINHRLVRITRKDVKVRGRYLSEQIFVNLKETNGIGFFESEYSYNSAAAFACRESRYENPDGFRVSQPFMTQAMFIGMKFNISPEIEHRVKVAHLAQFESGSGQYILSPIRLADSSGDLNRAKFIACLESVLQRKDRQSMTVASLSLRSFGTIWTIVTYYALAAALALVVEIAWHKRNRQSPPLIVVS